MKFEVENIIENEDGTCNVEYDYDEEFEEFVKQQLAEKNDGKEPTKEQVEEYFAKQIQEMVDRRKEMEEGTSLMEEIDSFGSKE
jgi:predicted house-cleaning noncanonical NTP pyrophosphatase (MazG superfamily)